MEDKDIESDYPECPICLDIYGNKENHIRAPKILKCGHSFCKECLEKIIKKEDGEYISCPNCNQQIEKKLNIDDYTTNIDVMKIVNSYFGLWKKEIENQGKDKPKEYKIITLGDSAVGKTCIFQRLLKDEYNQIYFASIGINHSFYYINYKKNKYQLDLIDTAGQEKFRSTTKNYLKKSDGVLFIFDISNKDSFDNIEYWYNLYKEEKEKVTGLLIGNKCDLELQRKVSYEEAKKFADENKLKYLETSAKLDKSIKKAIAILLEEIIESKALYISIDSIDSNENNEIIILNNEKKKWYQKCFSKC